MAVPAGAHPDDSNVPPDRSPSVALGARLALVGGIVGGAVALLAILVLAASPADAHAFLVRTDPAKGARLVDAPESIALQFSSPVATEGASVSVRIGPSGRPVQLRVDRSDGGRVLRALLVERPRGIYLVHWHVVADDGHESDGEFAFAAGPVAGRLPAPRHSTTPSAVAVVGSWAFFVGLALAAGGLVTGLVVDPTVSTRSASVRVGLIVMLAGAAAGYLHALSAGSSRREMAELTVTIVLACLASLAASLTRRRALVLTLLGAAAAAWALRGHAATGGGPLGFAVDLLHLGAGAVWVGALAHLVARLMRDRASQDRDQLRTAGTYARLALPLVVVLAAAGGISALRLLPSVRDLWSTGYGQLILAKSGFFAVALALALAARRLGLGAGRVASLLGATRLEAGAVAAVLLLTGVLVNVAPPAPAEPAADLLGPPPLSGPVVRDAGLAGILTVAIAYGDEQLQVEVLAPDGPAPGTRAQLEAILPGGRSATMFARPCGTGCLTQHLALPIGSTRLSVSATAPGWTGGTFSTVLPAPPPAEEPALLTRLIERMRAVPRMAITEDTSSGPGAHPPPVDYQFSGSEFLSTEPYAGGAASDVALLPDKTGFRLYVSGDRIWVTVWVNDTGRISREQVVDVGHQIERTFRYPSP